MDRRTLIWMFLLSAVCWVIIIISVSEAWGTCNSRACWERIRSERAWDLCVERHGARYCVYRNRFRRQPRAWRDYASAVFRCEGGIPWNKDGSGFILRAEWVPSTARAAGLDLSRIPTWHEEALAVIRWTKRVGIHTTQGWPNCP